MTDPVLITLYVILSLAGFVAVIGIVTFVRDTMNLRRITRELWAAEDRIGASRAVERRGE